MLDFDELEPEEPRPARRASPYLLGGDAGGTPDWERRYRQAYVDGFGAALEALAELAQEGDEAEDIHAALNEHWEESLVEWLAEDCGRRVEPPEYG